MSKNFEDGSYSCTPGIDLIAKVLAGKCKMQYTKATVGNGSLEATENPKDQTEVKGYVMDAQISAVTIPANGECQVTVQINSADVETGFFATGILLYAKGESGEDIPYTYLVLENEPEWIRPRTSVIGQLATFDLIVAIGDVDTVSAIVDSDAIATVGWVEQALKKYNSLENSISVFSGEDTITTTYEDGSKVVATMSEDTIIQSEYDSEGILIAKTGIYISDNGNKIEVKELSLEDEERSGNADTLD